MRHVDDIPFTADDPPPGAVGFRPPPPMKILPPDPWQAVIEHVADVVTRPIAFLWPGRLACKKLSLLAGDPGLGKTHIALDVVARTSRGGEWPDGGRAPRGNAIILTAEDDLADTIRPRLDALDADCNRIYAVTMIRHTHGKERAVSLVEDLGRLERVIRETAAQLVVIDPVSAYLPAVDTYQDNDVRTVLAGLTRLAQKTGVAVEGVMHLTKSTQRPALYRVLGSIGFVAAARIVHAVAAHPHDDTRRVLVPVKSNISAPSKVLAYRLDGGALVWDRDPVEGIDVETLLSASSSDRAERLEADRFLRDALTKGEQPARQLFEAAEAEGISGRSLKRAKVRLGIETDHVGYGRKSYWIWRLPKGATED